MPQGTHLTDIARVIQLAVAPVFLLSGVGVTLTVLTNRLSRIIDRARQLETAPPPAMGARAIAEELSELSRRAQLIQRSITLSTACALLICVVIVALFTGALVDTDLSSLVVALFIAAMCAFIGALLFFLREITVATKSLRWGSHHPRPDR